MGAALGGAELGDEEMHTFRYKGYGRIYCETDSDVKKVHEVIKEIDEEEYKRYMPTDLVAPFSEHPKVVYLGKFSDINLDLITAKCWKLGVKVWAFDAQNEYGDMEGF